MMQASSLLHFRAPGADVIIDEIEILIFHIYLVVIQKPVHLDEIAFPVGFHLPHTRERGIDRIMGGDEQPLPHPCGTAYQ